MNTNVFRPQYRKLTSWEIERLDEIKNKAQELHDLLISETLPDEVNAKVNLRYLAIARTELENSVMWAVKGFTA